MTATTTDEDDLVRVETLADGRYAQDRAYPLIHFTPRPPAEATRTVGRDGLGHRWPTDLDPDEECICLDCGAEPAYGIACAIALDGAA